MGNFLPGQNSYMKSKAFTEMQSVYGLNMFKIQSEFGQLVRFSITTKATFNKNPQTSTSSELKTWGVNFHLQINIIFLTSFNKKN